MTNCADEQQALPLDVRPSRNQSHEHWWAAWAVRQYFADCGATCVAAEVEMWEERPIVPEDPALANYTTQVGVRVDVLAIMRLYDALSRTAMPLLRSDGYQSVTVAAEVKVSRSDFKAGYCKDIADFNYVVSPAGLLKAKELPSHLGLIVCEGRAAIMRRRAHRIEKPRFAPEVAVWAIASACRREMVRMNPTIANPFAEVQENA